MEKPTFTGANLSDVRVIMTIMCVHVKELLYQAVMGWIPVLNCPMGFLQLFFIQKMKIKEIN
jgi:hypothetical protein